RDGGLMFSLPLSDEIRGFWAFAAPSRQGIEIPASLLKRALCQLLVGAIHAVVYFRQGIATLNGSAFLHGNLIEPSRDLGADGHQLRNHHHADRSKCLGKSLLGHLSNSDWNRARNARWF